MVYTMFQIIREHHFKKLQLITIFRKTFPLFFSYYYRIKRLKNCAISADHPIRITTEKTVVCVFVCVYVQNKQSLLKLHLIIDVSLNTKLSQMYFFTLSFKIILIIVVCRRVKCDSNILHGSFFEQQRLNYSAKAKADVIKKKRYIIAIP